MMGTGEDLGGAGEVAKQELMVWVFLVSGQLRPFFFFFFETVSYTEWREKNNRHGESCASKPFALTDDEEAHGTTSFQYFFSCASLPHLLVCSVSPPTPLVLFSSGRNPRIARPLAKFRNYFIFLIFLSCACDDAEGTGARESTKESLAYATADWPSLTGPRPENAAL